MSRVHSFDSKASAGSITRVAGNTSAGMAPAVQEHKAKIRNILRGPAVQAKLTISEPDDEYEREADRVADEVMRMPEDSVAGISAAPEGVQGMCEECEETEAGAVVREFVRAEQEEVESVESHSRAPGSAPSVTLHSDRPPLAQTSRLQGAELEDEETEPADSQRRDDPADDPDVVRYEAEADDAAERVVAMAEPDSRTRMGRWNGQGSRRGGGDGGDRMPEEVRQSMASRFGFDFGHVRIHTDGEAATLTRQLGARAFTRGHDIYFAAGTFDPASPEGERLLAHELAHVVQQSKGATSGATIRRDSRTAGQAAPEHRAGSVADSLSAAPGGAAQALPAVTGIAVGAELGVGRQIRATVQLAPGTPRRTRLTWSLNGAPAGVTIQSRDRGATIRAAPAALASAGGVFTVQCSLAATPADSFTSPNITLVGIAGVTFTPAPAFPAPVPTSTLAAVTGPANTVEPNRDGLAGNTATVNVVTAPAGRPTTVTLPRSLGAAIAGNIVTPGQTTGNIRVRVSDNATGTRRDETLPVNPVPRRLNAFTAQAPAPASYGVLNTLGWQRSDATANPLNRIVGETITGGGRDDFGFTPAINGIGPNPAPIPGLSVPANAWTDQLITGAGAAAGAAGDANPINVNRFEGPGAAARMPRIWILRQGFHYSDWAGNWSNEFDRGIHRRSLIRRAFNNYIFRTEHIFPLARARTFNEPYAGPPVIILNNFTATPQPAGVPALAADNTATATITVNSSVAGRNVNWTSVGANAMNFAIPAAGAAAPVANPATVTAPAPGRYTVRVVDSVFPNRRVEGTVRAVPVRFRSLRSPRRVAAGTLTADVTVRADPGNRIVNWTVDGASAAAGVTIVGVVPGAPAAAARGATVTRPAGFTGRVTVTATDSVVAAATAPRVIDFG
jgi:hypothetical protein